MKQKTIKILLLGLLVIANSLSYEFKARPKQFEILDKTLSGELKYGLFCGGVGSGKTATGSHFSLDRINNNPETIGFIGANTYKQLDQSTLKSFFGFINSYGIEYTFNKCPKYGYESQFKKHDGIISFPNGCQIITRSLDNFEDIRGIEIGWFWIDETRDTKKEAWDVIKARLRCKKSKLLCGMLTSTPNGYDWMYVEFEEKPKLSTIDKVYNIGHGYVISSTYENKKNLPENYIQELESSYDPLTAEQEIEGKFVNTKSGRVYHQFSREYSLKEWQYDNTKAIDLCFDINVDPMKWALIQTDNYGKDYIFDEFARSNTHTRQMAEDVRDRYGKHGDLRDKQLVHYRLFGDRSGADRDTRSRTTDIEIIKEVLNIPEANVFIRSKNPPVDSRINSVNARLNNLKGEQHLYVDPKCVHVIKDFEHVIYDKNGKIEKLTTDIIKKQLTHISDAIGYRMEYLYSLKGVPTVEWGVR